MNTLVRVLLVMLVSLGLNGCGGSSSDDSSGNQANIGTYNVIGGLTSLSFIDSKTTGSIELLLNPGDVVAIRCVESCGFYDSSESYIGEYNILSEHLLLYVNDVEYRVDSVIDILYYDKVDLQKLPEYNITCSYGDVLVAVDGDTYATRYSSVFLATDRSLNVQEDWVRVFPNGVISIGNRMTSRSTLFSCNGASLYVDAK